MESQSGRRVVHRDNERSSKLLTEPEKKQTCMKRPQMNSVRGLLDHYNQII